MDTITGTIRVTSGDGTAQDFTVSSPGDMIALAHRILKGSIHMTDHQATFIRECVEFSPNHVKDVNGRTIIDAFSYWCKSNNVKCPIGRNRLYKMMDDGPGVVRTNPHNKTSFRGLKLLAFERVEPNLDDSGLI